MKTKDTSSIFQNPYFKVYLPHIVEHIHRRSSSEGNTVGSWDNNAVCACVIEEFSNLHDSV